MTSVISDIWPISISLWRHVWRINILEIFYYHVITLVTGYCVPWLHIKQTRNEVDKWRRTVDFPISDIFDILRILEVFYQDVIIMTSSKVNLITGYCVPWLHVKQTRIGVDKWRRISIFPLLDFNHVRRITIIFVAIQAVQPGWTTWENLAFYLYWNTPDSNIWIFY